MRLDLVPRRNSFAVKLPASLWQGWRLVIDLEGKVRERFDGNSTIARDHLPTVDYRKG